jgi:hypothetical protein
VRVDLYRLYADPSPELDAWREDPPREVFVDGERVEWCCAFDIEKGCAWYVVLDRTSKRVRRGWDGTPLVARVTGNVTVLRESEP